LYYEKKISPDRTEKFIKIKVYTDVNFY